MPAAMSPVTWAWFLVMMVVGSVIMPVVVTMASFWGWVGSVGVDLLLQPARKSVEMRARTGIDGYIGGFPCSDGYL